MHVCRGVAVEALLFLVLLLLLLLLLFFHVERVDLSCVLLLAVDGLMLLLIQLIVCK